jgi:hypothetical protein
VGWRRNGKLFAAADRLQVSAMSGPSGGAAVPGVGPEKPVPSKPALRMRRLRARRAHGVCLVVVEVRDRELEAALDAGLLTDFDVQDSEALGKAFQRIWRERLYAHSKNSLRVTPRTLRDA